MFVLARDKNETYIISVVTFIITVLYLILGTAVSMSKMFFFQNKSLVCSCYNDMVNHSDGNKSTCTAECDPYVCGSPNGDDVSVYKRLEAEPCE